MPPSPPTVATPNPLKLQFVFRHAELRLDYRQSQSEINTLLHLSAFAFILTRYYGSGPH